MCGRRGVTNVEIFIQLTSIQTSNKLKSRRTIVFFSQSVLVFSSLEFSQLVIMCPRKPLKWQIKAPFSPVSHYGSEKNVKNFKETAVMEKLVAQLQTSIHSRIVARSQPLSPFDRHSSDIVWLLRGHFEPCAAALDSLFLCSDNATVEYVLSSSCCCRRTPITVSLIFSK